MGQASSVPGATTKTALQTVTDLTSGRVLSSPTITALTNASNVELDASLGNYFTLATTSAVGAVALTMVNHTPGQPIYLILSATGGAQVVTFGSGVNYVSSTLSVTQDKSFVVHYICDATRGWEVSRTTAITVA